MREAHVQEIVFHVSRNSLLFIHRCQFILNYVYHYSYSHSNFLFMDAPKKEQKWIIYIHIFVYILANLRLKYSYIIHSVTFFISYLNLQTVMKCPRILADNRSSTMGQWLSRRPAKFLMKDIIHVLHLETKEKTLILGLFRFRFWVSITHLAYIFDVEYYEVLKYPYPNDFI